MESKPYTGHVAWNLLTEEQRETHRALSQKYEITHPEELACAILCSKVPEFLEKWKSKRQ